MVLFALSCFGLLLFLWLSLRRLDPAQAQGLPLQGRVPRGHAARPRGRRAHRRRDRRQGAREEARPATATARSPRSSSTAEFAPLRKDARAILRQKTLLGETYVELTPGTSARRELPEGGELADAQVGRHGRARRDLPRASTRRRARRSATGSRTSPGDRRPRPGPQRRARQPAAVRRRRRPTCSTCSTPRRRRCAPVPQHRRRVRRAHRRTRRAARPDRQLRAESSRDRAPQRGARRDVPDLPDVPRRVARRRSRACETFAGDTDPLVRDLRPVARDLEPTLRDVRALAPDLRRLFVDLGPLITARRRACPRCATRSTARSRCSASSRRSSAAQPDPPVARVPPAASSDFISNGAAALPTPSRR